MQKRGQRHGAVLDREGRKLEDMDYIDLRPESFGQAQGILQGAPGGFGKIDWTEDAMDDEHGDLLSIGKGVALSETGDRTRGPLLERSSPRRFDIIPGTRQAKMISVKPATT